MFVAFDSLDDSSRLWMYGSETEFTEQQSDYITKKLTFFLENWEYHKNKLTASFKILEDRFIIIALDDSIHGVGGCSLDGYKNKLTASFKILEDRFIIIALDDSIHGVGGCSLDGLQRLIQTFENELSITLMNRLNVFCKIGEELLCIPTFKLGSVANNETLFYDLTLQKKSEINTFIKPIKQGWTKSFL